MTTELTRRILRAPITQWSPGIQPTWTIAQIRGAIREHLLGDFSRSSLLVDAMAQDDELPGALARRVDATLRSELEIKPVTERDASGKRVPTPQSRRIADDLEDVWWDIAPESELADIMSWHRMLGVGVGVLDWERSSGAWTPKLRTLPPHFLYRDTDSGQYLYHAREGLLEVHPGDGRWVLLVDGQRGYARCQMLALAIPWISKQLATRDWNRYNERHGLPIVKAMAPMIADEGDREAFFEDLKTLASETVALLPTHLQSEGQPEASYDLELLEATDKSWETFPALIARADRKFQVALTGGNASSEITQGGSRAAADTHRGVLRDLATADAERLATELRRQVVMPWVMVTVGRDAVSDSPWPSWSTEAPEDVLHAAEAQRTFGEAAKAFAEAGLVITNLAEVAAKYGLELAPAAQTGDAAEPPAEPAQLTLEASPGTDRRADPGYENGQDYIDGLATASTAAARRAVAIDVEALLATVQASTSYDSLKQLLKTSNWGLSETALAGVMTRARIMAELAGRYSVVEDIVDGSDD